MSGRRAILQWLNGRDVFRKVVLEPGQALRLGDDAWAHEVVKMPYPSGARGVDLLWDGLALRVDGLGPTPWFYLNGKTVLGGEMRHRDFLQIGGLQLRLTWEGFSYMTPLALSAHAEQVREALRACPYAYAVVDAARDRRILELVEESVDQHRSLYEGIEGRALDDVAPYLIGFEPSSRLLEALLAEGWGDAWGIFLGGNVEFEYARRHFRRYLMVDHDDGRRLYFRFYDPRTLQDFVPLTADWQKNHLFAPFDVCAYEGADARPSFVHIDREEIDEHSPGLTISTEQFQGLTEVHRRRLVHRITQFLREHYGDWVATYDDDALTEWVVHALVRAEHYGINQEREAIQMVLLWMVFGAEPETRLPWVAEILEEPAYEPVGKIRALIKAAKRNNLPHIDRVILSR
jgi:hypothetical protein